MEKVIKRQEALLNRSKSLVDLEDTRLISFKDRQEVDDLVRKKCVSEIERTLTQLRNCRSVLFQKGKTDLALEIKEVETLLTGNQKKISSPDYGKAFYLEDIVINQNDWKSVLDQDEAVLQSGKLLSEMAETINYSLDQVAHVDIQKIKQQRRS
jgi:hypothetical protein